MVSYHLTEKDVPLSDLVFRCDVAYGGEEKWEKPTRSMTTIHKGSQGAGMAAPY
ncbi:jg804, partial [Pararge aegeria aegeria]